MQTLRLGRQQAQVRESISTLIRQAHTQYSAALYTLIGVQIQTTAHQVGFHLDVVLITPHVIIVGMDGLQAHISDAVLNLAVTDMTRIKERFIPKTPVTVACVWFSRPPFETHLPVVERAEDLCSFLDGFQQLGAPALQLKQIRRLALAILADETSDEVRTSPPSMASVAPSEAPTATKMRSGFVRDSAAGHSDAVLQPPAPHSSDTHYPSQQPALSLPNLSLPDWRQTYNALKQRVARPVDSKRVRDTLIKAVFDQERHRELLGVNYIPNKYVVEVSQETYDRKFQGLIARFSEQLERLIAEELKTKRDRLGRNKYQLSGSPDVDIRPNPAFTPFELRITHEFTEPDPQPGRMTNPDSARDVPRQASLVWMSENRSQTWAVTQPLVVLGRAPSCDIYLDDPIVQRVKLVSSRHAHIVWRQQEYHLCDGDPDTGHSSTNGTFVNGQPIMQQILRHGDEIILASLDPTRPVPVPGNVVLRFYMTG